MVGQWFGYRFVDGWRRLDDGSIMVNGGMMAGQWLDHGHSG